MFLRAVALTALTFASSFAQGRGVSPYLPLGMSPEIERQIERLLILADKPVLTRPIAAATVLDALPRACERDAALCEQVRRYLRPYMDRWGLTHASLAAAGGSDSAQTLPNRRGMRADSSYEASAQIYFQPSDYLLVNAGFVAYEGETVPAGSIVSLGFEYAQLDLGYRGHWLSPMTIDDALPRHGAEMLQDVVVLVLGIGHHVAEGAAGGAVPDAALLQHRHARVRFGEVERGGQAGDAAADHRDLDRERPAQARIGIRCGRRTCIGVGQRTRVVARRRQR
jgi:hypothetical protein